MWPPLFFLLLLLCSTCQSGSSLNNLAVDHQLQATSFYSEVYLNPEMGLAKYEDKIIEVLGTVQSIERKDRRAFVITLNSNHPHGHIECQCADISHNTLTTLQVGGHISVKGIIAGFTNHILLFPCQIT